MFTQRLFQILKVMLLAPALLLLSACPPPETEADRLRDAADKADRAHLYDTPWRVSSARSPDHPERTKEFMANALNFVVRFDETNKMLYGFDGCSEFSTSLQGSGTELLKLKPIERPVGNCNDSDTVLRQRELIYTVLENSDRISVSHDHLEVESYRGESEGWSLLMEPVSPTGLPELVQTSEAKLIEGEILPPRLIGMDHFSGAKDPYSSNANIVAVTIIRHQARLAWLWQSIMRPDSSALPTEPIDFSRNTVIGIQLGEQPTEGYDIDLADVHVVEGEARVVVTLTRPDPSCNPAPNPTTTPAALFELPTRSRQILLTTIERTGNPCEQTGSNQASVNNVRVAVHNDTDVEVLWDAPTLQGQALSYVVRWGQHSITSDTAGTVIRGLAPTVKQRLTVEILSSGTLIGASDFWVSNAWRLTYFRQISAFEPEVLEYDPSNPLYAFSSFVNRISKISNVFMAFDYCGTEKPINPGMPFECVPDRFSEDIPFVYTRMTTSETDVQFTGYVLDQHGRLFVAEMETPIVPTDPDSTTNGEQRYSELYARQCVNPQLLSDGFLCE